MAIGTLEMDIYIDFDLAHDFARPRNQSVIWLYGYEPLKVSLYTAKFGSYGHSGSGGKRF